ncbi:cytochrome P450 94C1-like [Andrographis paniculata]|uniref:cytochrome P450 94C1-like n=1 Tax=Andrographis paniculata TaxID=175694 RepID=UPI0021E76AF3|nr:cytochrome P450 94C1-like [Andrographis paniculata]
MDSAAWPQILHDSNLIVFLSLATIMSFIFFIVLRFAGTRVSCGCDICQDYLKSTWTDQFLNLSDWYTHLLIKSPTRTIHIHVLNNTITANPDNVEYMLKTNFDNFPKGKPFSAILGDFLGRGIFNVDGDLWRFQKKIASLELGRVSVRAYFFEVVNHEVHRRLLPLLESVSISDEVVDLQDVFRKFSFDSICKFSFGLDPRCLELSLPLSEFAAAFDAASKLSAQRATSASPIVWKIKRIFNIGSERTLQEAIGTVRLLARDIITQRRKLGFSDQKDLLSRFMSIVGDEDFLRDIIISFLLAGRDTVTSALTSIFRLLALHPAAEAAILEEADKVLGPYQLGLTNYHQILNLHQLNAAVYESMRLYPPIQFDSKFCLEDDLLPDGSFVRKGTRVTYHPYAMGRMEEIWGSDCSKFRPERWLRNGVFFPDPNPFKYPVFQGGVRVCLGKELALLELKTVTISLLRRCRFEMVLSEESPRFSLGLTATLRDGLPVRVRAR